MIVILNRRKLRDLRKARDLTQEQFAEAIEISDRHMRTLENKPVSVKLPVLYRISRVLETPMEELVETIDEDD